MVDYKTVISIAAVILTIAGYIPYLKDTFSGKTTPHVYTWFIWTLVTAIAYALQVVGGAGVGSWVTLTVAFVSAVIFISGMRRGNKDITSLDTIFLILSLIALLLWLVAKQPILSVVLVSVIDILGFIPTIRKSWNKPYSETLFSYELNAVRHGISILALQQYSILTWLYPVTWTIANILFSLMVIMRRNQKSKIITKA